MKKAKLILKDIIKTNVLILLAVFISSSDQVGLDEMGEVTTWKEFIQGIFSICIFIAVISFIRNLFKRDKS
jgi:hypothetical protein